MSMLPRLRPVTTQPPPPAHGPLAARALGCVLALALALGSAGPALANCSERSVPLQDVDAAQASAIAQLLAGPDRATLAGYQGGTVTTTPAFEGLPPARRKDLLRGFASAYTSMLTPEQSQAIRDQGYVGSPVEVRDAWGRLLYADTACFGEFTMLTEHQRFIEGFALWTAHQRAQTHPLPKRVNMAALKRRFHGIVGWKPAYYLAWVPETGQFELELARADELPRLRPFWPHAPRGFTYLVLLNDGQRLATIRR